MAASVHGSPSLAASSASKSTVGSPSVKEGEQAIAVVQTLLQHVARAFYESKHVLVLEQLMRKEAMKDEELARRLGASLKDVTKMVAILVNHDLVRRAIRSEVRPGQQKASQRTYYYLDYKHCVNVIKWRMWKLSDTLDHKQRNVMDGQGYVCPLCAKTFSTLDIGGLNMGREGFFCDICDTMLVDNDNGEEIQRNRDRMQRFNQQATKIIKCLQSADKVKLPDFNADEWIKLNVVADVPGVKDDGLAVATGGAKETTVSVEMAKEGDEQRRRVAKEKAAEAKRLANALPVWIAQSTVTGELTSAGIKQGNHTASPLAGPSSSLSLLSTSMVDVKPKVEVTNDDEDLEAYYAQQQAQASSGIVVAKGSPSGDFERATSVASSSTSRKRSRDFDEGYASVENLSSQVDYHLTDRNGKKARKSVEPSVISHEETKSRSDEVMVSVAGKMVAVGDVTEDMHDEMTSEEYTIYVDLCA